MATGTPLASTEATPLTTGGFPLALAAPTIGTVPWAAGAEGGAAPGRESAGEMAVLAGVEVRELRGTLAGVVVLLAMGRAVLAGVEVRAVLAGVEVKAVLGTEEIGTEGSLVESFLERSLFVERSRSLLVGASTSMGLSGWFTLIEESVGGIGGRGLGASPRGVGFSSLAESLLSLFNLVLQQSFLCFFSPAFFFLSLILDDLLVLELPLDWDKSVDLDPLDTVGSAETLDLLADLDELFFELVELFLDLLDLAEVLFLFVEVLVLDVLFLLKIFLMVNTISIRA